MSEEQKHHAVAGLMVGAAESRPQELPALIESLPTGMWTVRAAIDTLFRRDAAQALELLPRLLDYARSSSILAIAPIAAARSPEKAFAMLSEVDNEEVRSELMWETALCYARRGLMEVLDSPLISETEDHVKIAVEQQLAITMALRDPIQAAQLIRDGELSNASIELHVLPYLFYAPVKDVLEIVEGLEDRGKALVSVLETMPEFSVDRVVAFLNEEEDEDVRRAMVGWYAGKIPNLDEVEAFIDTAARDEDHRDVLLREAAEQAMMGDRLNHAWSILSLAENLGESKEALLGKYAEKDPVAATGLLSSLSEADQPDAAQVILSEWAITDPRSAADWLEDQTGTFRIDEAAYSAVSQRWSREDPAQASAWIVNLSPGKHRDAAIGAMVPAIMHLHPEEALKWAEEIGDSDLRRQVVFRIQNREDER